MSKNQKLNNVLKLSSNQTHFKSAIGVGKGKLKCSSVLWNSNGLP